MKIEIIPAILPQNYAEVEEKVGLVKGFVKTVQIDVCDGQFTPLASWPYKKHDDSFEKISREEMGLPGWEELNFEIDLMANRPEDLVEAWVAAGAMRIIVHAEAKGDVAGAAAALAGRVDVGIAIGLDTPTDALETYRNNLSFIQCMGIDRIGFQGQEFDERVLAKIGEVRAAFPGVPISVDGGVSLETAPKLLAAGADRLVIGSAIFGSDNYVEALSSFKKLTIDKK